MSLLRIMLKILESLGLNVSGGGVNGASINFPLPSGYTKPKENPVSNFKFFTDAEIAGLQTPLPAMLDMTRGLMDPRIKDPRVVLTFTTGGQHCGHSAHYQGLAVDIGLGHLAEGFERDTYRWALDNALQHAGFERIEHCPIHTHVDIGKAPDYPGPVMILGQEA